MARGFFLNPLPVRRRKKAKKAARKTKKRKVKRKLTVWQRLVKKHKGNIKAAKKEYRRKSASGTSSTSRRGAAGSRKRRKPAGKRKAAPVAKRKRTATRRRKATKSRARRKPVAKRRKRRRRAVIAPSATWRRAVRRKTGKRVKARTTRKRSLKRWKAGMRKGLKRKGTRKWRRAVLAGVSAVNPRRKRRRRRRRNPVARRRVYRRAPRRRVSRRSSTRRYRNPISIRAAKMAIGDLIKKGAVKDYLYVTVGFVAGGVLPGVIQRALFKAGILKTQPSAMVDIGIGLGTAVLAGAAAGLITKKKEVAVKVAGGAVAGVLGRIILREIEKRWPVLTAGSSMSGFGGLGNDAAVRRGIEAEIRRSAGVGGEFISEEGLERELAGEMGAFVTQNIADASSDVSGLGADVDEDISDGTDTFGGGGF